jgi:flagellar biosynthesis/type III secretory pathway protein FliH
VNAYKKVPEETAEKIKKEVRMEFVETTIGEHFMNSGRVEGEAKGKAEGKAEGKIEGERKGKIKGKIEGERKGKIEGKIELLENLFITGVLTKEQFEKMALPLRRELNRILAESEKQV